MYCRDFKNAKNSLKVVLILQRQVKKPNIGTNPKRKIYKESFFCKMEQKISRRDELLYARVIERIIEIRKNHGHSQEYVGNNTKLDIPHYETGRDFPTLSSIAIFCKFYNMTVSEFFAPFDYPAKE